VFLATCFKYCSRGLPTSFFPVIAPSGCLLQTRYIYPISVSSFHFFKFLKIIFLLSPFENLHHSLFCLSILFLTFFSSNMFQMHLRLSRYLYTKYKQVRNQKLNNKCLKSMFIIEVVKSHTSIFVVS